VTDDRIVLLNEEGNDAAAKKISTLDKPAEFEPNDNLRHHHRQLRTLGG